MKSSIGHSSATMGTRFGFLLTILCFFFLPSATTGQSCIDDLNIIYQKEAFYPDPSFPRLYIVCPRHIFDIGKLDFNGNLIEPPNVKVHPPIPLRPNMTIRCGDDGSRGNLCWLRGGDLHLDGTKVLGIKDDTLENVVLEGFTFMGAREHALLAHKPGSVTFKDCEFRDFTKSAAPIMLDYYDASAPSKELVATFFKCDFKVRTISEFWHCTELQSILGRYEAVPRTNYSLVPYFFVIIAGQPILWNGLAKCLDLRK